MGKIYQMSETSNTKNILSGIYKITFPNGKCYIGLSNNIRKRIWKHNHDDYKLGRVVGNAIHKYGEIKEFEVLEEIPAKNRDLMNKRERYWINYYHSNDRKFGYNMTEGGDGGNTGSGVNNPNATLNQKQLNDILFLLENKKEKSMIEIAEQFSVRPQLIYSINNGRAYIQKGKNYPIRDKKEGNKILLTGTKSSSAKLNDRQLLEIIDLIQNSDLSFTAISKKYSISNSTIGLINKGTRYHNNNLIYPLRDKQKIKEFQYKRK